MIQNIGHSGTEGERNTGCGGEPFNVNFLNFEFVGPIDSYLGYKYHRSDLVFDFEKDDLYHEFQVNRIHSFENLRLVWLLSKNLKNDRCI